MQNLVLIILAVFVCIDSDIALEQHNFRDAVPRFKTFEKTTQEVYLGDKVRLSCHAISKVPPTITWYRAGEPILVKDYPALNLRENRKHMYLEIKKVEVSNQGLWSCKVTNHGGWIERNFTVEIIDFCEYFLNPGLKNSTIPFECRCLWVKYPEKPRRADLDYNAYNENMCQKYQSRILRQKYRNMNAYPCADPPCDNFGKPLSTTSAEFRKQIGQHVHDIFDNPDPVKLFDWLTEHNMADISHLLPQLIPFDEMWRIRWMLKGWQSLSNQQKIARARKIVQIHRDLVAEREENEIDADAEDEAESDVEVMTIEGVQNDQAINKSSNSYFSTFPEHPGVPIEKAEMKAAPISKPVFKDNEENEEKSIVSPAGRTIRLNCKASGNPEPKMVWMKNSAVLVIESPRISGNNYKFRKWSLELEDATEKDSGRYKCEIYNSEGMIARFFNVTVVNRMRSPPLIVPNILINQTVNVNGTASFKCKVVSDLVPSMLWMRMRKEDGQWYYYNETAKENMLRYTDMENVTNAKIINSGDESTLVIENITVKDQATYLCVAGNSLGVTMANATLFVNEFHAMEIPTGQIESDVPVWNVVLLVIIIMLLSLILGLVVAFFTCYGFVKKRQKQEDRAALLSKRRRVIVTHRRDHEKDTAYSDLPYDIQILEEDHRGKGRRPRLSSDMSHMNEPYGDYIVEYNVDLKIDEIARNRLSLCEVIGSGAFGEVWKAELTTDTNANENENVLPVAVKKVKTCATGKDVRALVQEMLILKDIGEHENILRLIGCCSGEGPLYVILELCEHGNLRDFLRAHRPRDEKPKLANGGIEEYLEPRRQRNLKDPILIENLTQKHLVQFAYQVARGMEYMSLRRIVHRDLAARNVLVAKNFQMKISDFGLSRDIHVKDYYRKRGQERIPYKWMAIESLDDDHISTIESDVWSFGILLWEIMTLGGTPYPTIAMAQLFHFLKKGYRMESPHNCPEQIYTLMVKCWNEQREERPTFRFIRKYLKWMLKENPDEGEESNTVERNDSDDSEDKSVESSEESDSEQPPPRTRKERPLSAPVVLPTEQQHSICDEDETDVVPMKYAPYPTPELNTIYHNYTNQMDYALPHKISTCKTESLPVEYHQMETIYSEPRRGESSMPPASVDSAIGSPAWHLGDSNYAVPFLGNKAMAKSEPSYVNVAQVTRFVFPPNNRDSRMSESGISDNYSNYIHGKVNPGFMPSPNTCVNERKEDLSRRYSDESRSSSGRGASATSSSEGLGGIGDFCRIEQVQLPIRQEPQRSKESNKNRTLDSLISSLTDRLG